MTKPLVLSLALMAVLPAQAVTDCELDGQRINTHNGAETAGKTGLLRCKDRDTGVLQREQELRDGKYIGALRYYKQGVLEQARQVNERGNTEGVQRTYAATPGPTNPLLREEIHANGRTVGLARTWHRNGQLQRATFYADSDGRSDEQAAAEFNSQGQLADLRCAARPQLAPAVDDAALCGHRGAPATAELRAEDGKLKARVTHEAGRRVRRELLWESGRPREIEVATPSAVSSQQFSAEGVKRREQQWALLGSEGRTRRITVLDREFHETGGPQRERRWEPLPEGNGARLAGEQQWYQNGQPRQRIDYESADGGEVLRREQGFHDNGQPAWEASWRMSGRYDQRATGVHKRFDEQGRLRGESFHDARGQRVRERELDAAGQVVRDDELFADGSRRAYAR